MVTTARWAFAKQLAWRCSKHPNVSAITPITPRAACGAAARTSSRYSMVLFLAALQTVPTDILEAVKVDGANRWQSFSAITLPLIAPFTLMVTILLTIASFKTFALIQLMTKGGPGKATTVLAYYIYQTGLQLFDMGYASAIAVVLFVAVLTLTILQLAARRRWVFESEVV
jgi:ABC-type sugar transport system permease subunit